MFRRVTEDELAAMQEDAESPFTPVPTASASWRWCWAKLRRLAPATSDPAGPARPAWARRCTPRPCTGPAGARGPFIAINCAAIPENLVESELFGYARGAHSTADRTKAGLLEQADGGTLFLDEIGEMPLGAQTKLLRFLQSREVLSLGATRARTLDVRVIAATNRPVAAGHRRARRAALRPGRAPGPRR